ncbi:hypothetical protein BDR07DRAFT_398572 [Suillus spraguei]|nr:hypothetical protein BDR07DRAFT_398572 [Suillus spraguei]
MYTLNCIVFGDDSSHIFQVEIEETRTVGHVRKAIKDSKEVRFGHVDADDLKLWQVDLHVDEMIEHNLRNLTLDPTKSLLPVRAMSKVFESAPQDKHLHIVIQCSPAVPYFKLNCIVLGDCPDRVFGVDIAQMQAVCDLIEAIKYKKKPDFDRVPAARLDLWQVNISLKDSRFLDATRDDWMKLEPANKLSTAFTDVKIGYIHVVVQRPPVA